MWHEPGTIEGFFATAAGELGAITRAHDAQARFTSQMYRAALRRGWIARWTGVTGRLQEGGTVADIGCGQGSRSHDRRTVHGRLVHRVRPQRRCDRGGTQGADRRPGGRGQLEVGRRGLIPGRQRPGYDGLLHRLPAWTSATRWAAAATRPLDLAPGGTVMVVEPLAADRTRTMFTSSTPARLRDLDDGVTPS